MADARSPDIETVPTDLSLRAGTAKARGHAWLALAILLICAAYYVTGVIALSLRLEPGGVSTIWLPHGVLLAALILTPPRYWWLVLVAVAPVHLFLETRFQVPVPLEVMLIQFGGNAAQSLLGAIAVRRLIGTPPRLDVFRNMIVFIVLGVILPALVVSMAVAGLFDISGWIDEFGLAWHRRTLTGICGALLLAPLIIGVAAEGAEAIRRPPLRCILEYTGITIGVTALELPAGNVIWDLASQQALLFAPLPLLLWTAVRFGPTGLTPQLLIVALAALAATKAGHGPFFAETTAESVLSVQAFLLAIAVPKLLLAALVADRNRSARALDERLGFERLVSEVSASLINPPQGKADEEVGKALGKVTAAMKLDRCSVFQYLPMQHGCRITHSAESAESPPLRREMAEAELPWMLRQLQAGRTVVLNDIDRDLPPEAIAERRYAGGYRSRSWLTVPVSVGNDLVHAVSFHSITPREWTPDLVARLQLLAEIFVSSLTSKQAKEALHASEERYREVVESQTELVCRYLPDTTLTFVNSAYCRFFGRRREELIGRKFLELIPEAAHPAVLSQVDSLVREPRVHTYDHEVMRADGTIGWQQWVDSAIVGADGRVTELQGIGRDITDRKRAEEATQRLAHASRLAVMGELTASIAHEINQPLNAILNNADAAELLLETGSGRLDEVQRILADIRRDDLRASEVIRRIRELMRNRPLDRQPVDLKDVAASVVQLVGNDALKRGIRVETEFEPGLPAVLGDGVHLQQVLLNLILNGMDAMADASGSRRRLSVRVARGGGGAEVAVSDWGNGVDPSRMPMLFDSFFTTKEDGMGLGLSIARSIVEAHGGRIWAENRTEGGATFRFSVPIEPA